MTGQARTVDVGDEPRRSDLAALLVPVVIAVDQATKQAALLGGQGRPPPLSGGMSFGPRSVDLLFVGSLGEGATPRLAGLAAQAIAVALAAFGLTRGSARYRPGFALLLGGALGNAVDRWSTGAGMAIVTLGAPDGRAFAFNVADAAVAAGLLWVLAAAVLKPSPADAPTRGLP